MFGPGKMLLGSKAPPVFDTATAGAEAGFSTTISFAAATSVRIGQLQVMILTGATAIATSITPPAGWSTALSLSGTPLIYVFYRILAAADAGSQVFTYSLSRSDRTYTSMWFKNAKFGVMGTPGTAFAASVNAPAITAKPGLLVGIGINSTPSGSWSGANGGMTEIARDEGGNIHIVSFLQTILGGSTGTRTLTNSMTTNLNAALFSIESK